MPGALLVVATPIGNLEDLSARATRALHEADLVVAEDARVTRKLLAHVGARTRFESLHAHSPTRKVDAIARRVADGGRVALVTDAGTPGVSDPGAALVRAVARLGGRIEAVPGPSAVTAAASASGLCEAGFRFVGFLPRKGVPRRDALVAIATSELATVLFEAPGRTARTLRDLAATAGADREAVLCREVTKLHEEIVHAPLGAIAERTGERPVRGEVTLVVAPAAKRERDRPADLESAVRTALAAGLRPSEAAAQAARLTGARRTDAYALALRVSRRSPPAR